MFLVAFVWKLWFDSASNLTAALFRLFLSVRPLNHEIKKHALTHN